MDEAEWVRETMRQFGEQLSDIRRDVADVRERMIKMEAASTHSLVEDLQKRIDALEADRDKRAGVSQGVSTTADWLHKLAPWIFATALVVASNWQVIF